MSKDSVVPSFHKLKRFPSSFYTECSAVHAINDGGYLSMSWDDSYYITGGGKKEMIIHKYSPSTNQWTEEVVAENVVPKCSVYDPISNCLYIVVDGKVREINLRRWDITTRFSISSYLSSSSRIKWSMVQIGTTLHIFASKHLIIDISKRCKWKLLERRTHPGEDTINAVFCKSRNSIILYDVYGLEEYSLDTKQWEYLRWSGSVRANEYSQGTMMTLDRRFFLCFGGDKGTKDDCSGRITIYDLKRQEKRVSSIKCPLATGYQATLLGNHDKDILSVFGFVNQSYKEEAFQDIQLLPRYLIELIAKWYRNEHICLIADTRFHKGHANHWRVNVDDILNAESSLFVDE